MEMIPSELAVALVRAQGRANGVEKASRNAHHGYRYASAEDVIAEATAALAAEGLAAVALCARDPTALDAAYEDAEEVDERTQAARRVRRLVRPRRVQVTLVLVHQGGATWSLPPSSLPVLPDRGRPEDKAELGARTEALAYALRDLLLMPRLDAETPSARADQVRTPLAAPGPATAPAAAAGVPSSATAALGLALAAWNRERNQPVDAVRARFLGGRALAEVPEAEVPAILAAVRLELAGG